MVCAAQKREAENDCNIMSFVYNSFTIWYGSVAQLVEQAVHTRCVGGSSPLAATNRLDKAHGNMSLFLSDKGVLVHAKKTVLSAVKEGHTVCVVGIACECTVLKRRLTEIGFVGDEPVTVLKNSHGPVLVMIKNARIGVGRAEAAHIFVREITP